MNEDRATVYDELEQIWKDSPAYLIDWLREHSWEMTSYLLELQKDLNDMLKKLK